MSRTKRFLCACALMTCDGLVGVVVVELALRLTMPVADAYRPTTRTRGAAQVGEPGVFLSSCAVDGGVGAEVACGMESWSGDVAPDALAAGCSELLRSPERRRALRAARRARVEREFDVRRMAERNQGLYEAAVAGLRPGSGAPGGAG